MTVYVDADHPDYLVKRRSITPRSPLTSLTSSKFKFEWHSSHQQAFDKIKKFIGTEEKVHLCYPGFNKPVFFHLYTDASDHQLEQSSCRIKSL
jgi:hypothetical protein